MAGMGVRLEARQTSAPTPMSAAATQMVGRIPTAEPDHPASSDPTITAPTSSTRNDPLIRPSQASGASVCRSVVL